MIQFAYKFICLFCVSFLLVQLSQAQTTHLDSLKAAQQKRLDSLEAARKFRADSLASLRAYRQSQRYNDSVDAARQRYRDSIIAHRKHINDSLTAVRQRIADSLARERQRYNDSLQAALAAQRAERERQLNLLKAERQRINDSLAAIRAYRQSPRYRDSVAEVRQHHRDSLAAIRQAHADSIRAAQQARQDSMRLARQQYNDSLRAALDSARAARQHMLDSLATIRQARGDSLAALRAEREKLREKKKEEREEKKKLAFELKIKKKQDAYTNEKMRKKKWSFPRSWIQNTFTRYNYYFNANLKMEEAIGNMLQTARDDYDSLISLFPFDPDVDSAKLASDMDTIISKASVGIQIHDPRSKWQDDLYLLAGQAFYYKADYKNAEASFKQIIALNKQNEEEARRKKGKKYQPTVDTAEVTGLKKLFYHAQVNPEAMLWLARTFTQNEEEVKAQTILDMVKNSPSFPEKLKGRLALEQAFLFLKKGNERAAITALQTVNGDEQQPDWLRQRATFLTGQLLQREKKYHAANEAFEQNIALHPDLEMDFYAHKHIAENNLASGSDATATKAFLTRMTTDGKYRPYYDQIYYGLAEVAMQESDPSLALDLLRKSLEFNQNNTEQKGLTFARLGETYYQQRDYLQAKIAYDSAAMFLTNRHQETLDRAQQRADALDQIAAPAHVVRTADSLLHLASLSEKEQRNHIKNYIRDLERQLNDSLLLALNAGTANSPNILPAGGRNRNDWYFTDPVRMQKGKNEFKQKWGNRKLADNWRRSMIGMSFDGDIAADNSESPTDNLPNEDSLYAAIPHTPEAIDSVRRALREAYFQLGKGYYTYLEDYQNTLSTFDTLLRRFPQTEHQDEILYTRYLIAMRQNKTADAQQLAQTLTSRFPDSDFSTLVAGQENLHQTDHATEPGSALQLSEAQKAQLQSNYDDTYSLLMDREYAAVIRRVDETTAATPRLGDLKQKYFLLKAVAIAGTGHYREADSLLSNFISKNPNDSLTPWAGNVLNYIRTQYDTAQTTTGTPEKAVSDTVGKKPVATTYQPNPAQPHFIIIVAEADTRIFALKAGLMDYERMNASAAAVNFTLTTLDPGHNMIVGKSLPDAGAASGYLKKALQAKKLFREYPKGDYQALIISQDNFQLLQQQKDMDRYLKFYRQHYR